MQYSANVPLSRPPRRWLRATTAAALGIPTALAACKDHPPGCISLASACEPAYPPTFDNVYNQTIAPKCGGDGNACHSVKGMRGGLVMNNQAAAFANLLAGGNRRVVANDAACSGMVVRLSGHGHAWVMPPEHPLSEAEQCAVRMWIQNGAIGP
jgi:hypothetical protein